jgi:hypothetical protein
MSLSYGLSAGQAGHTQESLSNRKSFLCGLGIDYRDLVCARQVHSDNIGYAQERDRGRGALSYESSLVGMDALITDKRALPLAVFTADCLPVFLYDRATPAIGLVHAGWRGSLKGITAKAILAMGEYFKSNPQDLYAGFGPAIRGCCYEVGEKFSESFRQELLIRDEHYYLDLASVNKKQLLNSGVREENIADCAICTSCNNEQYFSFRKEGDSSGRMISVIMLK